MLKQSSPSRWKPVYEMPFKMTAYSREYRVTEIGYAARQPSPEMISRWVDSLGGWGKIAKVVIIEQHLVAKVGQWGIDAAVLKGSWEGLT